MKGDGMETIALHDISESEMRALLQYLPELWKKNSGFFDTGIKQIFSNFGETENTEFGVHIFSHRNGSLLIIILSEYLRDTSVASFNINGRYITGWFSPSANIKGEMKLREILENLTYGELEEYAVAGQHLEDDSVFICPDCGAQYLLRVLRVTIDGRTECQNCKHLFDPVELEFARRADSYHS
jgi:predicted RNA-binding Zn-ribbon protein involved in translation (DUF1610 family)